MEKFGMNFGGGPSKKDLLETIEAQKKQLLQYQARLKDVVRAYKSLLKEKEALEASLKVLSASHEAAPPPADAADDRASTHSEDSAGTAASQDTAASLSSTKGDPGSEEERRRTARAKRLSGRKDEAENPWARGGGAASWKRTRRARCSGRSAHPGHPGGGGGRGHGPFSRGN